MNSPAVWKRFSSLDFCLLSRLWLATKELETEIEVGRRRSFILQFNFRKFQDSSFTNHSRVIRCVKSLLRFQKVLFLNLDFVYCACLEEPISSDLRFSVFRGPKSAFCSQWSARGTWERERWEYILRFFIFSTISRSVGPYLVLNMGPVLSSGTSHRAWSCSSCWWWCRATWPKCEPWRTRPVQDRMNRQPRWGWASSSFWLAWEVACWRSCWVSASPSWSSGLGFRSEELIKYGVRVKNLWRTGTLFWSTRTKRRLSIQMARVQVTNWNQVLCGCGAYTNRTLSFNWVRLLLTAFTPPPTWRGPWLGNFETPAFKDASKWW